MTAIISDVVLEAHVHPLGDDEHELVVDEEVFEIEYILMIQSVQDFNLIDYFLEQNSILFIIVIVNFNHLNRPFTPIWLLFDSYDFGLPALPQ